MPLKSRLASIYLSAAAADGEVSDEELEAAIEIDKMHDQLGSELDGAAPRGAIPATEKVEWWIPSPGYS